MPTKPDHTALSAHSTENASIAWAAKVLLIAGWPPIAVLLFHVLSLRNHFYVLMPNLDSLMHFVGGIAIAHLVHGLHVSGCGRGLVSRFHPITHIIIVVALTCTAAMLWEFYEFLSDHLLGTRQQLSIADTMKDMFLGMTGSIAFLTLCPLKAPKSLPALILP